MLFVWIRVVWIRVCAVRWVLGNGKASKVLQIVRAAVQFVL